MTGLTWTCHICGEERPDAKISVRSTMRTHRSGVHLTENVRYCNDRPACAEAALDFTFFDPPAAA